MTGRGAANALTRTTSILAAMFFATSITLALLADRGGTDAAITKELTGAEEDASPLSVFGGDADRLGLEADDASAGGQDDGASARDAFDAFGADAVLDPAVETPEGALEKALDEAVDTSVGEETGDQNEDQTTPDANEATPAETEGAPAQTPSP